jgi:hypothetical protein
LHTHNTKTLLNSQDFAVLKIKVKIKAVNFDAVYIGVFFSVSSKIDINKKITATGIT